MKVDELSKAIEKELTLYMESSTETVKREVKRVATDVKKDISDHARVGRRGKYAKSWQTKLTDETATSVTVTVHANKNGYNLAHLLEFGHAKRGGGRTRAFPHIKPAEQNGIRELERNIRRELK